MSTKITYLLGAGASANAVPVVDYFSDVIDAIIGLIESSLNGHMECPHFLGHKVKIISSFQSPPATYNR